MGDSYTDLNENLPETPVEPEPPRKKGFARLWEIITNETLALLVTGLLALVGMFPFIIGIGVAYNTHSLLLMIVNGIIGGMFAAPGLCGLTDTLLRCLREEAGQWWERYRRAIRREWKYSLLPGALFGLAYSMECFTLLHQGAVGGGLVMLICLLFGLVIFTILLLYLLMQTALMQLPFIETLKNSVSLALRFPLRSLLAGLIQVAYWFAIAYFFPGTSVIMVLTSAWFPLLLSYSLLYDRFNEAFRIETRLMEERMRDIPKADSDEQTGKQ